MAHVGDVYEKPPVFLFSLTVAGRGPLEDVNEVFRAVKAGEVARSVLMFD